MSRFLTFFLVSFLLHLTVGALLLSRTGILGGKGTDSTELSDLGESLEETSVEEKAQEIEPKSLPPPVKKKPKKIVKKKKPVPSIPKKQSSPETTPDVKALPKPAKTESKLKEPEKPLDEKKPDAESENPLEKTEEKTKEEWVDEDEKVAEPVEEKSKEEEIEPLDGKKEEKAEEETPQLEPEGQEQSPAEGEEKEPKLDQNNSVPSGSTPEKAAVPSLNVGTARIHSQLKQLEGNPLPVYPKEALKKRWEGKTEVFYYVNRAGFVEKIQLERSSGHSALDNAALRALSRYRYYPGQEGWVRHPVEFLLELDKEVEETAPLGKRESSSQK